MKLITCPDTHMGTEKITVFLAGGITNCPDWQKEMASRFIDMSNDLALFNPRRSGFDATDPTASNFQIEWEFEHLQRSDGIIFWFPYQTLCPITLYELGVYAARNVPIVVGCHPAYQRKFDIEKQLNLLRPDIKVYDSFDPIVEEVKRWFNIVRRFG